MRDGGYPPNIEGLNELIRDVQDKVAAVEYADHDPDIEVIMHPDDFPELESILGFTIIRSPYIMDVGTAYVVNKKRLMWQ